MTENDAAYHYPPEVFEAVVQAVPLIVRSKQDVLTFFRGCGVNQSLIEELRTWTMQGSDKSKYHITRRILTDINELGDSGIRVRREVIKRITEIENFDASWENDRLKAQGAVAALRDLVNKKDTFTRLKDLHEQDEHRHRQVRQAETEAKIAKSSERAAVRTDLGRLFSEIDPHRRGKALEDVLNRLFDSDDIGIREAFTVTTPNVGVVEQIDGAIEIDGHVYLVEMKWWSREMSRGDVASHLVSVFNRGDVGGIFISNSKFLPSVVQDFKEALTKTTVILVELREIVMLLESDRSIIELLRPKIHAANLSKNPLIYPLDR